MNELIKKTVGQILDYSHQSTSPTYFIEITLYFIFLKYIVLQDKNEREINIESFNLSEFFNDQISIEDAKKVAIISVEKFIKQNDSFFDNDSFKGGFQDIFTNWIFSDDYRPAFRNIAEVIYGIEDKKELIDIFESLLSQFGGRFQGEFNGSDNIHKIISGVLGVKKGTVYDPACGSGQLLVEIQKNAKQKIEFFGKEINTLPYGLAKINFYIHELSGELQLGDTFASDINENMGRFDYTVCEPPLGMRLMRESLHPSVLERFSVQSNNSDQLWLQYVIESLNITGKGVILLPMSSTFKKIHSSKRKELVDDGIIDSIILLPKGILRPYAAVDVVLWIFDKGKNSKDVFFIDGRELPVDEIIKIQNSKSDIKNKSKRVTYEDIVKYDFNLNPGIQVNGIEKEIENYSEDKRNIGKGLKKFINVTVPSEFLDGLTEELQLLIKKGKSEGKITYDELLAVMPHAEDDVDKLDDIYTRFMKLNIEIVDSLSKENLFKTNIDEEEQKKILKFGMGEKEEKKHEYEEALPKEQKKIEDSEKEQKRSNLDNITKFNDKIHEKILGISNFDVKSFEYDKNKEIVILDKIKWYNFYPRCLYKKIFADWNENTKNSMRLTNIISLNSYIYNNDPSEKIENQRKLVEYFDKHLEKEWLLKAKGSYAERLFWFLVIESIVLVLLIIWAVKSENKDFIELIKIFASVGLGQIALMVTAIVTHLFPKNGDNS